MYIFQHLKMVNQLCNQVACNFLINMINVYEIQIQHIIFSIYDLTQLTCLPQMVMLELQPKPPPPQPPLSPTSPSPLRTTLISPLGSNSFKLLSRSLLKTTCNRMPYELVLPCHTNSPIDRTHPLLLFFVISAFVKPTMSCQLQGIISKHMRLQGVAVETESSRLPDPCGEANVGVKTSQTQVCLGTSRVALRCCAIDL